MSKITKTYGLSCVLMILCVSFSYGMGERDDDKASSGSGFFINSDGIIITNAHVIDGANIIYVFTHDNDYHTAQIISRDDEIDLAVLKVNYRNPYHFRIADFNLAKLGERLRVLGFPLTHVLGNEIRFTEGNLSSTGGMVSNPQFFQISVPIQPGNSGGPIMNDRFEIIGVATAGLNRRMFDSENVNFGIKSGYINDILKRAGINSGRGNIRSLADAEKATIQIYCEYSRTHNSSITIINNTGVEIRYLYISPVTSATWGEDRLGFLTVLPNNRHFSVRLPYDLSVTNRYNIRLIDWDEKTYTKYNVHIFAGNQIVFTLYDID